MKAHRTSARPIGRTFAVALRRPFVAGGGSSPGADHVDTLPPVPDPKRGPRSAGRPLSGARALGGVVLAGAALGCAAEPGVVLQGGRYDSVETVGLQVVLDDWFRAERGGWRVVGYPELQVNRHELNGDKLWQGGVFATFRVDPAHARMRPYLEAGLGANVFSRGDLGSKDFSTRFQFGEHIGIGVAWGGNTGGTNETWVGLRFTHYSNAGIKKPNPGLEALQLVLGHRF
ncbi:MAG: acyloxyacyl hydrolase [Aromatoleum sp.]|jgi:hypothetical protein|uniref:acyloxyacyl hydrolase n=1 Tax=Aromatoleum sp. TaxID=2307007 RepID=UPI0028943943|nr:acyloxyacyl hydrolase [Aromatoleum sp.]MDT3671096.1 acyloxyacyl hydrolase [Aromatoleum sp.]